MTLSERIYAGLLRLYPAAFRETYGREMLLIFRDQCRDAYRKSGRWGIAQVWLRTLADLARSVPAEHIQGAYIMFRRACDIAISLLMLWLGLPFLLLMALLIKLESPGPAFYVQQRIGRNGEGFKLYKLRSMSHEPAGRRVTRIGRFLRLTMLEEYPQFYNVLRGDMTLFGPRPLSPERDGQLAVKPGFVPWFSH